MKVYKMTIQESLPIIKSQLSLGRTPDGMILTEYAKENLKSVLADEKNYHMDAVQCDNCRLVISSLLIDSWCPQCGYGKFDTKIKI